MPQTITTNLSHDLYKFLKEVSFATKKTKRQVLEEALELYKWYYLEQKIKEGFESAKEEYMQSAKDFENLQLESIRW